VILTRVGPRSVRGGEPGAQPLGANPAPSLSARTGRAPEYNVCWEEMPIEEEMVQVDRLLAEITELTSRKLTGAVVALSFCKRLTQPIQERVHPGYKY